MCSCFLSSDFAWGQARSKLGGLLHAFCITILYANSPLFADIFLIRVLYLCYFVVFCVLQFYKTNLSESEFSWKKHLSDGISSGRQKIREKTENKVSSEITGVARRTARGSQWASRGPRHPLRHPFGVLTPRDLISSGSHFVEVFRCLFATET